MTVKPGSVQGYKDYTMCFFFLLFNPFLLSYYQSNIFNIVLLLVMQYCHCVYHPIAHLSFLSVQFTTLFPHRNERATWETRGEEDEGKRCESLVTVPSVCELCTADYKSAKCKFCKSTYVLSDVSNIFCLFMNLWKIYCIIFLCNFFQI